MNDKKCAKNKVMHLNQKCVFKFSFKPRWRRKNGLLENISNIIHENNFGINVRNFSFDITNKMCGVFNNVEFKDFHISPGLPTKD